MKFQSVHPLGAAILVGALVSCSGAGNKAVVESLEPDTTPIDTGPETLLETGSFDIGDAYIDPEKDNDGDGYVFKEDCNDFDPLVNPGAFEVMDDKVDNDCDGAIDNPEPVCDTAALKFDSTKPLDFAKSLNICRNTTAGATGKDKRWGVIKADLLSADGVAKQNPIQHGILKKFGTYAKAGTIAKPRAGATLVALSSGTARSPDDSGFITPISPSWAAGNSVDPPMGWPKTTPGCSAAFGKANDSSGLKLTIRVPTNAKSFRYNFSFYSSEYINYVCSPYNDSFVAILDTKAKLKKELDKNISYDSKGNPVNVNSGFFEYCTPGMKGGISFTCLKGTANLEGSGFWDSGNPNQNGSTGWLQTKAPVIPGETITIFFIVWDASDHILDTTVLLDNWTWDASGTSQPVTDRPK